VKRFEFQAELFGLTQAQRDATIAFVSNALQGHATRLDNPPVVREQVAHQNPPPIIMEVVIQVSFVAKTDGDALFDTVVSRAQSIGATDAPAPWDNHSYVRMTEVDDVARTITRRYAQSTGWVESTTTISMDD
jgi:hypothetical protein